MRTALIGLFLLAGAAAPAFSQDQSIRLFNGRDLEGWSVVADEKGGDSAETWSVADGVLRCKGRPIGYVRTDKEFGDYTLTLEWRWPAGTQKGNSGVLVHTSTPRAIGVWPKSIEVQLAKDNAGDFWIIGTELNVPDEASRKSDRRYRNLTDDSEKPAGEWNHMEIVCRGATIQVKVNGHLVNEATNCSVTRGAICLQSEGTPIEFRKIVLTPLAK